MADLTLIGMDQYRAVSAQKLFDLPSQPQLRKTAEFANKWFENSPGGTDGSRPGFSNVKHVLGGSAVSDGTATGIQVGLLGETPAPSLYQYSFPVTNAFV
jgi:hypothetical protein